MDFMRRTLNGLFVLTVLFSVAFSLSVDWLLEVSPLDSSGNGLSFLESQRKSERLARELQDTTERTRVKESVTESVLADEMTLVEAASWFRSLYRDPCGWHNPNRPCPEYEDAEAWCREVMEWLESKVLHEHSPSQAEAMHQRWENELRKQRERSEGLQLPE